MRYMIHKLFDKYNKLDLEVNIGKTRYLCVGVIQIENGEIIFRNTFWKCKNS